MSRSRLGWVSVVALVIISIGIATFLVSQRRSPYPIETGPRAAWLYLNARALGKLNAAWDETTNIPTFISSDDSAHEFPISVKPGSAASPN